MYSDTVEYCLPMYNTVYYGPMGIHRPMGIFASLPHHEKSDQIRILQN